MWSKWTATMAVPWKNKMVYPMTLPGNPGCYCPIKSWTSTELFIAHWQIYHIDQHTSRIICEHSKDGISCHYMTDREADSKTHINKLHESFLKEKPASNSYVPENTWLDLISSWSINDLERSYKTFPESCCGNLYDLFIWVIIDTDAKDTRTKANVFRVPVYASQEWDKMISLGTQTIKEMLKASAEKQESTCKTSAIQKKSRTHKAPHQKSKVTVESESSDSADEQTTKSTGGNGAKTSSKPRSRSSETATKTISTDSSLLMPKIVDIGQTEFDVCHRAKPSGVTDIQQSMVASSPDDTTKFGLTKLLTQLSKHLEQSKTSTATKMAGHTICCSGFKGVELYNS